MRDVFASELEDLAAIDDRVTLLTADLGFGVFERFIDKFPNQYLNVGVAEQNMLAVACGLALEGRVVFAYSIGNFPTLRCLEQIRNDAAYHEANVNIVSVGGGFSYGPLGMSHHATEDLAIMRAIPRVQVFSPGTLSDVAHSVHAMAQAHGTAYLRLDKSHAEERAVSEPFRDGQWRVMERGGDATIVACGGVLQEALVASARLAESGLKIQVVNATQLSPLDHQEVMRCLGDVHLVVTLEEHVVRGGLGGAVAEAMATSGHPARLVRVGVGDEFVSEVGSQAFLRQQIGLDAESVCARVLGEMV